MKKRGIAIIVTLLVLSVVVVLSYALMDLGVQNLNHAQANLQSKKALLAAEAGITQSLRRLRDDRSWSGAGLPGVLTTGKERYSVEVTNNSAGAANLIAPNGALVPPGTVYLLSTGFAERDVHRRQVGVLVRVNHSGVGFHHAIFGYVHVDIANGSIDSYNSNEGPYPDSRNPNGGAVGTNNPDPPPDASNLQIPEVGIEVGPTGSVNAVEIGPSGSPAQVAPGVNSNLVINLDSALSRDLARVSPPFPPGENDLNLRSSGSLAPGAYGDVSLAGSANVELAPGTYVFQTLDVGGNATLRVDEGVVRIYVVGDDGPRTDLSLQGNSLSNTTMVPGNLLVFVGAEAREVKVGGGPQVAMALLAPLCDVRLDGTAGDYLGAIVGHTVTLNGQPAVHYDEALGQEQGGGGPGTSQVLSWQRF